MPRKSPPFTPFAMIAIPDHCPDWLKAKYETYNNERQIINQLVPAVLYYKNLFNHTIRELAQISGWSAATVHNDLHGNTRNIARLLHYLNTMGVNWEIKVD